MWRKDARDRDLRAGKSVNRADQPIVSKRRTHKVLSQSFNLKGFLR